MEVFCKRCAVSARVSIRDALKGIGDIAISLCYCFHVRFFFKLALPRYLCLL